MNLSTKTADKIANRYATAYAGIGSSDLDRALDAVIRRAGGLCAALNEGARRDLILTLGDNRRANERYNARSREVFAAAQEKFPNRMAAE